MIAACNGIALHGGFIPSGASFFCFTDYCRPSLRLSALMGIRVVNVFTHDLIGLGEDGPTHQPVEHLASLRAMPNFYIWRPADSIETVECWQAALEREHSPSILALTRQSMPAVRLTHVAENLCARGGYEVSPASGEAQVSIFASGSEVSLAVAAQAQLKEKGVAARVVSMPCFPAFFEQPEDYRRSVIGNAKVKIGVEAAVRFGWDAIIGDGPFIGMKSFGESGPYKAVYKHFGITPEAVVEAALEQLQGLDLSFRSNGQALAPSHEVAEMSARGQTIVGAYAIAGGKEGRSASTCSRTLCDPRRLNFSKAQALLR